MDNATVAGWKLLSALSTTRNEQIQDQPNYWIARPETLISQAHIDLVKIGTGYDVFRALLPELEAAESEIVLVTCFWARSATLDALGHSLRKLSRKAIEQGHKIRVRICFSSLSLVQKLFHTRSPDGRLYPASCWMKSFGLPDPRELQGLDLQIKSIFVLPFSVMHPKFLIIDQKIAYLPSCNVSWENWFEGCVKLTGPIVAQFSTFYKAFWSSDAGSEGVVGQVGALDRQTESMSDTVFLPSPHHAMQLFDQLGKATSPSTPLNLFTLEAFRSARRNIYIQTPNLTAGPVLDAILEVLTRGTNVSIVTSERLMILEQLVTARTTTSRCVRWLIKQHKQLQQQQHRSGSTYDLEAGRSAIGRLAISYFKARPDLGLDGPVQTHLKLTIIDDEIVLLGSGNMDRASWVTSQELGLAIVDRSFATEIRETVAVALKGRLHSVYS